MGIVINDDDKPRKPKKVADWVKDPRKRDANARAWAKLEKLALDSDVVTVKMISGGTFEMTGQDSEGSKVMIEHKDRDLYRSG